MEQDAKQAKAFYFAAIGGRAQAIEHENAVLSIGRDLLPECAREVLDGHPPTAEYWRWLESQIETWHR